MLLICAILQWNTIKRLKRLSSPPKMKRSRTSKHVFILFIVTLVIKISSSHEPISKDLEDAPRCSLEMCELLFDRLEEQSVRLHNVEETLFRTVSILASVNHSESPLAMSALKSDPLINSFLIAGDLIKYYLWRSFTSRHVWYCVIGLMKFFFPVQQTGKNVKFDGKLWLQKRDWLKLLNGQRYWRKSLT